MLSEEERKRREQEAINIINSINNSGSDINTINTYKYDIPSANEYQQEYINRVKRANDIINSINPTPESESIIDNEQRASAIKMISALEKQPKVEETIEEEQPIEETIEKQNNEEQKEKIEKIDVPQSVNPNIKEDTINNSSKINGSLFSLANLEETKNAQEYNEDSTLAATLEANKINKQLEHATPKEKLEIWLANQGDNFFSSLVKKPISGLVNIGTTLAGLGIKGVQGVAALFGNTDLENSLNEPYNNVIRTGQDVKNNADYTSKVTQQINDPFIKVSGQANDIISYMMGNAAIGYATGINPTVVQGLTVGGNSAAEVLEKNKDNVFQGTLTGLAKGYTSYLTENMFDSNILTRNGSKSSVEKFIDKQISEKLTSEFGKEFAHRTVGIIGENLEEFAEDNIGYLIDKLVNNEDLPSFEQWINSTSDTVAMTTLTTFVMQLLGLGGVSFKELENDMEAQKWINEAQKIIDKENLGIHFNSNEVKDTSTIQDYYITKFTPDGDILGIVPTKGVTIPNTNTDLNVTPVVVRDLETGDYNIIDGNTGVMLDSTYYDTRLQAEESYNEKVNKLSDLQIKEINDRVAETSVNISNKVMDMINQAQEEVNNMESNYQEQQNTPTQITQTNAESNFYTPKTNYAVPNINQLKNEFEENKTYSKDELYDKWYDDIVENGLDMIYNEANPDNGTFIQLEKENGDLVLKQYSGENEEAVKSITIPTNDNGVYTSENIQNAIEQAATMYDENRPIKGQVDIEGNEVRSMKKGVSENEGKRSRNVRQEANRKQERKNTSREGKNEKDNGSTKKELSKSLRDYEEKRNKGLDKKVTAEIVDTDKQSPNERIVSKGFKEATGLDLNIYATNQSTSEGAFYNANNIFLKHNSLANKKSVNFRSYHEFGHWLKDNKPEQWNKLYDIVDKTITKQQIEDYKNVLNDKSEYDSMSESKARKNIINEIVSDYVGNWSNNIENWLPFIEQQKISQEYAEFLADITLQNQEYGYNVFGSLDQQEQINDALTEIMNDIIENTETEINNDVKYSNRNDVDKKKIKYSKQLYNDNGELKTFEEQLKIEQRLNTPLIVMEDSFEITGNNNPIFVPKRVISKAKNEHGISKKELYNLPEMMQNYVLITKSQNPNKSNSIIVFLDQFDSENRPIIVTMDLNKDQQIYTINEITSIYGRDNIEDFLTNRVNNKVLKIDDKKIKNWLNSVRVQFPEELNSSLHNNNISQKNKNVKSKKNKPKFSDRKDIEDERKIQGLENYTVSELKEAFKADVETILEENGIDDVNIIDIDFHGSRLRGTAKKNSDLDVVVQYDGDIREDDLFNILNEKPLEIEGITIDINPIQENIEDYMERSKEYDQKILSKNLPKTDNEGNKLTKAQQEFFKDSKARDDNGNLSMVYHTTTDRIAQFNEFNPTTTKYYRFGDQIVNYFTDSQDMSGSYADSAYKVADTAKIENIDQAKKWIDKYNNLKKRSVYNYTYDVEKADNGTVKLIQYERRANGQNQRIGTYAELKYKDLIQYVQMLDHNFNKIQYQGYLNITNPYIVDAEGKNWNKVQSNIDNKILSELDEIKKDKDKVFKLKNLQAESLDKYLDYISGYKSFYEDDIKGIINDIGKGQNNDFKEALEYCMMFGFNFDEYVKSLGEDYDIDGNTKIKDVYDNYLKNQNVNQIENYKSKMIHFADKTINDFLKKAHEYYTRDMMYGKEYSYFKENYAKIIGKSFYDYSKENNITPENLYKIAKDFFSKDIILEVLGDNETTNDIVKKVLEMNKNGFNYDGIIMKNVIDYGGIPSKVGRSAANLYVTFNSNQFKAKDNKNPTDDPDIRYSDRYDTDENGDYGFYSQLEKTIEEKMPNTSNAQQINGILNNAGIKQDEMKWIGLDDYLKAHSLEKITKQQVMDYIKANQIYIETAKKGMDKLKEYTDPIKEDIINKNKDIKHILDKYGLDYEEDDLIPYTPSGLRATTVGDFMAASLKDYIDFDKFEKQEDGSYIHTYKDSNGTNWTSQFTEEDIEKDMQELEDLYDQRTEAESQLSMIQDEYGDYADELEVPKYERYSLEGGTNYQEKLYTVPGIKKIDSDKYEVINNAVSNVSNYTSPHWNEKNVLAHVRTQDFEDINGNKVLFIDEIQSDLHQEGRKKGYVSQEDVKRKQELNNKINDIRDTKMNLEENLYNINQKIKKDLLTDMANKQTEIIKRRKANNVNDKLTRDEQYALVDFQDKMNQIYSTVIEKHNIFNVNNQQNMIDLLRSYEEYHLLDSIKDKFKNNMKELEDYIIDTYKLEYLYDRYTDIEKGWSTIRDDETQSVMTNKEYKEHKKMIKQNQDLYLELEKLEDEYKDFKNGILDVFPFKKNWHEFALRRIINDAVSQGYDEVAWTTGRQQRERYNLSKVIDQIEYEKLSYNPKEIEIYARKNGDIIFHKSIEKEKLADYIGKDLAMKIINSKEQEGTITNLDEEVRENGNSGMYLFYDQEIPAYLNKYLKKWDSKVETIILKDADGKKESVQPGFKITDKMRNSIKQDGQPLYSSRNDLENDTDTEVNTQEQEERRKIAQKVKNGEYNQDKVQRNAERENAYIEQEIQKLERTGDWDTSIPVTKLTDIRKVIEDYLGLGIKKGHFRQHAYGIYKNGRDVIRTKEFKDLDTILHETGHALDLGNRLNVDKQSIGNELLRATAKHGGYEKESRKVQLEEGFAEVIREYSVVPEQAKAEYPQSVAIIEALRSENKQFDNFMTKVQKLTYNYIHQVPENRVLSNVSIGEQTDEKKITKNYIKQEIMRNVYDSNYALKSAVNELAKASGKTTNEIKASDNAYYLTRLASGITDKVTSMLSDGYIDENGNKLMPGLNKLGEILGNDKSRFNDLRAYLVAKRDTEYKAKTLKTGIRSMDSKAVIEQFQNDKQIQEAAKVVYDTLDGVLQYAVNNHLIDQETAKTLRESNAFYVPMQRVLENDKGNQIGRRGAVADIIKQRTGSELDIKDVLENIVTNSSNVIQQVENNNVLKALYKQGESSGVTSAIYDVIPAPMTKIGTQKLGIWENELIDQGVKTSKLDLEKTIDIFAPNHKVDAQNLITSFINDNGKRVYLQFYDDLIFNNIMGMDKKFMSQVLKFNSKLNMPLRYGATMGNIGFAIPNMISDTAQAAIFSTAGFVPVVDNALGVLDILSAKSKLVQNFVRQVAPDYANRVNFMYDLFKQTGSTNSTRMSQYRGSAQSLMNKIYGTNGSTLGINEKFKPLKRLLDLLTYIPDISEQSTRFRVFQKNYEYYQKRGNSEMDSRILAALEARDATQDFSRTGNITREINQLIPFSAARVGSAYTFSEKVAANPKMVAFRTSILLALAMAIKAIGYDDKEIDELQQRKKDDNFVIRIGDKIVTIKKPQGVLRSTINLIEYIQDLATGHIDEGKEGERLGKWINNAIMDNMPSDEVTGLVPNAVAPLIENAINKDFYYNTDIVKSYDQDLPDYMQYYDYNSQLAIWLGKVFNYSPAKIDNLISGYFGGLGTQTTNIMDTLLGKMGIIPEKPNMGAEQNSVGKRFVVNVNTNSQSIDDLYNRKSELTKKKNGGTITAEETQELEKITNTLTNVSKINKQIREVKSSTTLNGDQKADQIRALQQQKTDLARESLNKEVINSNNTNKNTSIDFFPSTDSLKKNNYSLTLTPEMKKEYEKYAYEYYSKYETQGLYSEEKLKDIKSKAKDYAKTYLFQKYKDKLVLNK